MEWVGLVALGILLCYASYPGKVKRLEGKMKRLEKRQKGESAMSKLISELVNTECKINTDDALPWVGSTELKCYVTDADDEWIKVRYTNKKNIEVTRLLRIEHIDQIEMIES